MDFDDLDHRFLPEPDVIIEGMGTTVEKVNLTRQIQELREQIQEMKKEEKKVNLGKRISVPVSREEFKKIHLESAKAGLPKGHFIRQLLIGGETLPALDFRNEKVTAPLKQARSSG